MQRLGKTILTTLALALLASPAFAQDAPAAKLPKAPVPYSQIQPKRAPAPKPTGSTTVAAAKPAAEVAPPVAPSGPPIDPVRLQAFLDGWMADAMARGHVPGASVSIVQNGQVILKKGYGFADLNPRRPVDPERTLFRIGSISKTFTWILLMKEVEARRIRLDRPINLYLPEKVRLPGKAKDVMVANLLDHSAGFEDRALGQLFEKEARRVRPLDLYLRQERPDLVRPEGVLASYSNYGAALAGEAVAFVGGKTFERRVEDEITLPLNMNHTTFREARPTRRGLPAPMPDALRADLAQGYGWRDAGFFPNHYEFIGQAAPAGSASSTAGDMSRYMLMLLGDGRWNGVTIFGPQAARAFRTPLRQEPRGINGWAHGFMTFDLPGGHKGYGHLGSTIAFHSNMTVVPDLGLGVFVTTNGETGRELAQALPDVLVQNFFAKPTAFPRPGSAELVASAKMFDGAYLTTRRTYGGLEGFVTGMVGGADVKVTSGGRLIVSRGGQDKAFVPEGPVAEGRFISTLDDERLKFRMQGGRATGFQPWSNTETLQRASFLQRPLTLMVLSALVGAAALATLAGLILRNRRDLRQNQIQARASTIQAIQAGLWLAAILLFAIWGSRAANLQAIMYNWPGVLVVTASACALVAAALTLITIVALPAVWQGGRRVDSWNGLRKMFFTMTVLIYAAFSVLLAIRGGLEPWSR